VVVPEGVGGEPDRKMLRGAETILLVEDDAGVRGATRRFLEAHGYTVLEATQGREALRLCEKHCGPIDLLITDVVMPEMSGRDVAERLKPSRPNMKVLFMSGYTDKAIVHRGELDPGTAFLQKPFTPDALSRKVREVLDSPR
jgi:two-component system cell cycle sensor histidine kinase/response regulator CckA